MVEPIRVAIFGVGNCAKSLVQGVAHYSTTNNLDGLMFPRINWYEPEHIKFVLAYDVDSRKVCDYLATAISKQPNCAMNLVGTNPFDCCKGTKVEKGVLMDGIGNYLSEVVTIHASKQPDTLQIIKRLQEERVNVAVFYLPVGAEDATRFYADCCLEAGVPFVNCIPVFLCSDPNYAETIRRAGICAAGDDIRSQFGASILSQVLQETMLDRGIKVKFHCQTNQGGNTDFLNMQDRKRLTSKKKSKEAVIRSQCDVRSIPQERQPAIHAGPSEYIPYLGDNKVAHIRIEAEGFGGAPLTLDCRLSVQDSPNSAGIVIDAIRFVHVAQQLGIRGPLVGPSAALFKSPPKQLRYSEALQECHRLAAGQRPSHYWQGSHVEPSYP